MQTLAILLPCFCWLTSICARVSAARSPPPTFLNTSVNIIAHRGTVVNLPCAIRNLRDGASRRISVHWLKTEPVHRRYITIGPFLTDHDPSYTVVSSKTPESTEWNLRITDVQMRHAGVYECVVFFKERLERKVTLDVVDDARRRHPNETDVDYCASNPCQNGATCIDRPTSYDCYCDSGFTGPRCDLSRDPDKAEVRLVNGSLPTEGNVEIFINGTWGVVCDDHWDERDARVVCQQLGYDTETVRAYGWSYFSPYVMPRKRFWLDDVMCQGNESQLIDCMSKDIGTHDCGDYEHAGVSCGISQGNEFRLRLANGSHSREGRVEVLYKRHWWTICDQLWDTNDATVVCRQLGYKTEKATAFPGGYFGQSKRYHILWDSVSCSGNEAQISQCSTDSSTNSCDLSNKVVGVLCDTSDDPGIVENCTVQFSHHNWSLIASCDTSRLFSPSGRFEVILTHHFEWNNSTSQHIDDHMPLDPVDLYYNLTDNKEYYRGRILHSWTLFPTQGSYLGVEVSLFPSNTTTTIDKRIIVSQPSRPVHNCSSLYYISESGTKPCACATGSLGTPPGRLIWLLGNDTMATGEYGVKELLFPFEKLTNQHDTMTAICRLDWIEPVDVFGTVIAAQREIDTKKNALNWAAIGGGSVFGLVLVIISIVMIVKCRRGHNIVCCWRTPLYDILLVTPSGSEDNCHVVMNTGNNTNNQAHQKTDAEALSNV